MSKKTYSIVEEGYIPTTNNSTKNYDYMVEWGDVLTHYDDVEITYDDIGNPISYYTGLVFSWNGRELAGAVDGSVAYSFTYNDEGIRTSKTKNGVTTNYYLSGSQIIAEKRGGNITVYIYDASGAPIGMQYRGASYASGVWDIYWYEKNLFGDIVAVYDHSGTKLITYTYDAWGNFTTSYHNGTTSSSQVAKNPFRYRGYYYDQDLNLYYLQTRYYDSNTGRFVNADRVDYLGANGDINSYNLYAYCSNNPIMFVDPTGHGIITALLVGALVGAAIGGTVGGVAAYNSAKESGANGLDLFWETVKGVGKGALVGGVAGGFIGASVGAFVTYGISSVVTTATITTTVSVAARATEVAVLQTRKSRNDGDSGWQVLDDVISSSFNNMGRILSPIGTKSVTTLNSYIGWYKFSPMTFGDYFFGSTKQIVPYFFAAASCYSTIQTIKSSNPIQRAYERGFSLK